MALDDGLSVDLVLPIVLYLYCLRVLRFVLGNLLERGTLCSAERSIHRLCHVARTADVVYFGNILTVCKARTQLRDLVLAHAVQQQIRAAVGKNGRSYRIVPVVVVCEASERSLESADNYRYISVDLAKSPAIDDNGAVGTLSRDAACGIRIIGALSLCGSIMSYHRVDISRGHEKSVFRSSETCEIAVGVPVGLSDYTDRKSKRLDKARNDRRTEARVIDISIARDINIIELSYIQLVHFSSCCWEKSFVHSNHP